LTLRRIGPTIAKMRLLYRTEEGLEFKWFDEASQVRYAILSHRWLDVEEEVTYKNIKNKRPLESKPKGRQKIVYLLDQAAKDGLEYAWIYTCCIDKTSSVELSEAINTMYYWYQQATICYVFLHDVAADCPELSGESDQTWLAHFAENV